MGSEATSVVIQPGVWGSCSPEGIQFRPGWKEWWAKFIAPGPLYPYFNVFNHVCAANGTDDQSITLDSDCVLVDVTGSTTQDIGSFRAQFYEIVDSETGLSHMRLPINNIGLVGTAQYQRFLPHPYPMTAGQQILSRCQDISGNVNNVQIVIFSLKKWKANP